MQQQNHPFLVDDKVTEDQKEVLKENLKKMKKKDKKIDKKKKRVKKQDEMSNINNEQIKGLPFSNFFNLENLEQGDKPARQDESDNYSEGGSDSESSDEDYDKAHLKMMQKNIGVNREMFKTIFKNTNYLQAVRKQNNNNNLLNPTQTSKRNSRKGRSLLSTSKDPNKNLSDSNQKIRNNSTSTENRDQKIPEKKGIYVSKTIHMRPLTANQPKKNPSVAKIEEEQGDEIQLKEFNSNRPSTVGQKKLRAEQKNNNQSSKKNLSSQQVVQSGKEQVNIINYQQTLSKNAQKPPINNKQNASKTWLLMMKSVSEYEQEKKQKVTDSINQQQFSQSREDFFEEIKERGLFSNFQGELNRQSFTNRIQQKPNELQSTLTRGLKVEKQLQQEEVELKNINQILIHTPNSIIDQSQEQYFRKVKQDGFKPKGNCPSAFYAMKKHFNLKKKDDDSITKPPDKNFQRIPLLGNNRVYQNYQAKIYGAIAYRENSLNNNIIMQNNYNQK